MLDWYHNILVHLGLKRTEENIRAIHVWKGIRTDILNLCNTCDTSTLQENTEGKIWPPGRKSGRGYQME